MFAKIPATGIVALPPNGKALFKNYNELPKTR